MPEDRCVCAFPDHSPRPGFSVKIVLYLELEMIRIGQLFRLITAAGAGMLVMSLLDPVSGRRRRARARDKFIKFSRLTRSAACAAGRDMRYRGRGLALELAKSMRLKNEPVSDEVLVQRIRARIGRLVSHPHAVHVTARQGPRRTGRQTAGRRIDAAAQEHRARSRRGRRGAPSRNVPRAREGA